MVKTAREMVNKISNGPRSLYTLANRTKELVSDALSSITGSYVSSLGIDLGTSSTLISVPGKGVVLNEPSVIAVNKRTRAVAHDGNAVGSTAQAMIGKTPKSLATIRPMQYGVISDFEATEAMLACFIKKVCGKRKLKFFKPRVTIAVPRGTTEVERRAVTESAERIGASKVFLLEEPLAAGLGAGLPIASPTASMIIDIGGGTTEVAIISLGDIATCQSVRVGGNDMDNAIIDHIKRTYNLLVGEQRAEKVKIGVGSAAPLKTELTMEVLGRDTISGVPRTIVITSEEVREVIRPVIADIIETIIGTLEIAPPELAADLIDNGIHICGGSSMLREMDTVLSNATGLTTTVVESPIESVVNGTESYMEHLEMWSDVANHLN